MVKAVERDERLSTLHSEVGLRLAGQNQRYLSNRQQIVELLAEAGRPLGVNEMATSLHIPVSTIYRNLTILAEAQVVRKLSTVDDSGRFELDEALSGHHHHHLICIDCGEVIDADASEKLERAVRDAALLIAAQVGFEVLDHRLDLIGRCADCSRKQTKKK